MRFDWSDTHTQQWVHCTFCSRVVRWSSTTRHKNNPPLSDMLWKSHEVKFTKLKHGVGELWPKIVSDFLHKPSVWMHSSNCRPPAGFICLYLCTLILPPSNELKNRWRCASLKNCLQPLSKCGFEYRLWSEIHSIHSNHASHQQMTFPRINAAGQVQNSRKAHPPPSI